MTTLSLNTPARRAPKSGILAAIMRLDARFRQANALRQLDAERLADLGLTRRQADAQAGGLTWDVPLHWQR